MGQPRFKSRWSAAFFHAHWKSPHQVESYSTENINVMSPDNTTRTMQHERAVKFVPAGLRAITIRLAQCYEDYYEKYCRLVYFLQLTPWPTMKSQNIRQSWGLLPIFDLCTVANIEAWNKMRVFIQTCASEGICNFRVCNTRIYSVCSAHCRWDQEQPATAVVSHVHAHCLALHECLLFCELFVRFLPLSFPIV